MLCDVIAKTKIPIIGGYCSAVGVDLSDNDIYKLLAFYNEGVREYVSETGILITEENVNEILGGGGGGGGIAGSGVLAAAINVNTCLNGIMAGEIIPAGTTNEAIWRKALISYLPPDVTFNQTNETHEVGESYGTINLSSNVTRKSKAITSVVMNNNGALINSFSNVANGGTFNQPLDTSANAINNFTLSVVVSDGTSNITKSATKSFIRYGFYGTSTSDTPLTTSEEIRALSNKRGLSSGNNFTLTIPVGTRMITIAYPATVGDISSVKFVESLNAEIKSVFNKTTVNVEGANGVGAIPYKVFTQVVPLAFDSVSHYDITI